MDQRTNGELSEGGLFSQLLSRPACSSISKNLLYAWWGAYKHLCCLHQHLRSAGTAQNRRKFTSPLSLWIMLALQNMTSGGKQRPLRSQGTLATIA